MEQFGEKRRGDPRRDPGEEQRRRRILRKGLLDEEEDQYGQKDQFEHQKPGDGRRCPPDGLQDGFQADGEEAEEKKPHHAVDRERLEKHPEFWQQYSHQDTGEAG